MMNPRIFSKAYIFLSILGVVAGPIIGQQGNYRFAALDASQGLRDNYNEFLFTDSRGYVWVSSIGGIYRYNGIDLEKTTASDGTGLIDNNVQGYFFEDTQGDVWFATNKGINRYSRRSGKFLSYHVKDECGDEVYNAYRLIHLQNDSILWLKAEKALYRLNVFTGEQDLLCSTNGSHFAVDTLENGHVNRIIACPWYYSYGFEEIIMPVEDSEIKIHNHLSELQTIGDSKPLMVMTPLTVSDSNLWLCTDFGLIRYDTKYPSQMDTFSHYNGQAVEIRRGSFLPPHSYLLTTRSHGLLTFDISTRQFTKDQLQGSLPTNLKSNSPNGIYYDQNHEQLWVSHRHAHGINYAWTNQGKFWHIEPFGKHDTANTVSSIVQDSMGRLWCTVVNRGLYVLDQSGAILWQDTVVMKKAFKVKANQNGTIWVMKPNEIGRYQIDEKFNYESLIQYPNDFFDFCQVSPDVWVVTTNKGIRQIRFSEQQTYEISSICNSNQFETINVFSDQNGHFYLATSENILKKYRYNDLQKDADLQWEKDLGNTMLSFWTAKNSSLVYAGTMDDVYTLQEVDGLITDTLFRYGFISKGQVLNITQSDDNLLWFSTYKGLYRYHNKDKTIHFFRQVDGLDNTEFIPKAQTIDKHGRLWLGTGQGLILFQPDSIQPYPFGTRIQLEEISINEKPLISTVQHSELQHLTLRHFENTIDIKVVAVGTFLPDLSQIRYRLVDFEDQWRTLPNGGIIHYHQLPPGDYRLVMQGINANGVIGERRHFKIQIHAPFWKAWWFWLGIVILLISMASLSLRLYVKMQLRRQRQAFERKQALDKALQNERNRIAGEMHDDLGGGLTSIQLLLKRIRPQLKNENSTELVSKVENQARDLIENMSEIIWAMNSSYDNLPDLLAYLRLFVVRYLDDHNIKCDVEMPNNIPDIEISGKKRRNTYLAIKECTHNIVKHAKAQQVFLRYQMKENSMVISICDDGIGFDRRAIRKFGNGLDNINERMCEIGGKLKIEANKGTQIQFTIPFDEENQL